MAKLGFVTMHHPSRSGLHEFPESKVQHYLSQGFLIVQPEAEQPETNDPATPQGEAEAVTAAKPAKKEPKKP